MLLLSAAFAADMLWTAPNGASIRLPPGPSARAPNSTWVMLYWPSNGPFQTNVNVQQQSIPAGLDAWWELSRGQFSAIGLSVVSSARVKVGRHDAMRFEYSGTMMGSALRWDAVGVYVGTDVWLATCTAPAAEWASWGPACKQSIDSFMVP